MNKYQNAVKAAYTMACGNDPEQSGDTFYTYLMQELSDEEGCDSPYMALRQLEDALSDIKKALAAIKTVEKAILKRRL